MTNKNLSTTKRRLLLRLEGCPYCVRAEAALDQAKIEYSKIEIDRHDRSLVKLLSGQSTVPVLLEVVGCESQDDEIVEYAQNFNRNR